LDFDVGVVIVFRLSDSIPTSGCVPVAISGWELGNSDFRVQNTYTLVSDWRTQEGGIKRHGHT